MKQATTMAVVDNAKADPRIKLIAAKIKKENYRPEALIEILHTAQNAYGYLPMPVLAYITKALKLPPSRVFSAVTFYHFFSLKSKGEHTCLVCTGTACYVKGANAILQELEKQFGIKAGQVTADEKLGIQVARCVGACGLAPVVVVDDQVEAKVDATHIVSEIRAKLKEYESA
jgi:bidirectional [NiFe] hydrogenase diaphorase subunit